MIEAVFAFVSLCVVLALAYYATRWLGTNMTMKPTSKYIQVIDRLYLDRDKMIVIVYIDQKYKVLAISGNAIETIDEFDELPVSVAPQSSSSVTFSDLIKKYQKIQAMRKNRSEKDPNQYDRMEADDE